MMSFFGFDPTKPPQGDKNDEVYDFENTYDGLGELEEDDAFNTETFGTSVAEIRKDFDFGHDQSKQSTQLNVLSVPTQTQSYAQAAQAAPVNDDEFMQELWGTSNAPTKVESETQNHEASAGQPERKILSLEEIEAQLTAIDQSQQQQSGLPQQGFNHPGLFPPQGYGMPGMIPPPNQFNGYMFGGYMPPQYGFSGRAPPQQLPPLQELPPHIQQQYQHQPQPHPQVQPPQGLQNQPQLPTQVNVQDQQQAQAQVPVPSHEERGINPPVVQQRPLKVDLSQFPVLGKEALQQHHHAHQQASLHQQQQHQQQSQSKHQRQYNQQPNHQQLQDLTPEEQAKAAKRLEKVSRIMKYSGIMNPRDKDFVTRFQLSHIVTEDPYNEDFYAQVYKVIHPKVVNGVPQPALGQQNNSIAQAYLDHSGHRLGGRFKRADVALQRMQQQVQKAVHVAKGRPKFNQYAKEGALGKISFASGKKPRQQLEIISKAAEREKNEVATDDSKKEDIKRYSRKDIFAILENIISELMNVESESRVSPSVDTTKLWESMKVLEQASSSGDDEAEVNPFIQCLNYNKMLKILVRLFKFLNREQILTITTLIMSNLENLSVVKYGSYTTYPDKKVPEKILKLVDAYSMTFSKILINAVLEFKFNEIIGLLVILIEHNNVSFVSTTKIGLTILTTLLSRAELIIGEGQISATDLSEWTSCYDELFTALESRIAAIFPPHPVDVDDGSSKENYIWQFLATLSLGGKLSHQRIIVDEVRDEIFGAMNRAKAIDNQDLVNLYKKQNLLNNLNMFLVVMGLVADENDIKEL